jgi:hypothetical protein
MRHARNSRFTAQTLHRFGAITMEPWNGPELSGLRRIQILVRILNVKVMADNRVKEVSGDGGTRDS